MTAEETFKGWMDRMKASAPTPRRRRIMPKALSVRIACAVTSGAFCVFSLGLASCGSSDRANWEENLRNGTKLLLEPREWNESEKRLEKALELACKIGGDEGERLESITLPMLWNAKLRLEKLFEAETLLRRNVDLDRRLRGSDDRDLAYPIGKLAGLLSEQKRYLEAKPLYAESLRIEQLNNSPKSFSIAGLQLGLGDVSAALGDSVESDSLYRQALSIYRTAPHPDSRYKRALETYHRFLLNQGRLAESSYIQAEIDSVIRNIETLKRNRSRDTTTFADIR